MGLRAAVTHVNYTNHKNRYYPELIRRARFSATPFGATPSDFGPLFPVLGRGRHAPRRNKKPRPFRSLRESPPRPNGRVAKTFVARLFLLIAPATLYRFIYRFGRSGRKIKKKKTSRRRKEIQRRERGIRLCFMPMF